MISIASILASHINKYVVLKINKKGEWGREQLIDVLHRTSPPPPQKNISFPPLHTIVFISLATGLPKLVSKVRK